jgi:hypothetical protein
LDKTKGKVRKHEKLGDKVVRLKAAMSKYKNPYEVSVTPKLLIVIFFIFEIFPIDSNKI